VPACLAASAAMDGPARLAAGSALDPPAGPEMVLAADPDGSSFCRGVGDCGKVMLLVVASIA